MTQIKGFAKRGEELNKSIYGLKQSPRCWNTALDTHLKDMGFAQSTSDPYIYRSDEGGEIFYLGVYVDNIILAGCSEDRIKKVKAALSQKFEIKDMGKLHHFLGMSVVQDETRKTVWIGQPTYTENLLQKFGMQDCTPVNTPVTVGSKLEVTMDEEEHADQQQYQSAIGEKNYFNLLRGRFALLSLPRSSSLCTPDQVLYFTVTKQKSMKESNGVSSVMSGGDPGDDKTVSKPHKDLLKGTSSCILSPKGPVPHRCVVLSLSICHGTRCIQR